MSLMGRTGYSAARALAPVSATAATSKIWIHLTLSMYASPSAHPHFPGEKKKPAANHASEDRPAGCDKGRKARGHRAVAQQARYALQPARREYQDLRNDAGEAGGCHRP